MSSHGASRPQASRAAARARRQRLLAHRTLRINGLGGNINLDTAPSTAACSDHLSQQNPMASRTLVAGGSLQPPKRKLKTARVTNQQSSNALCGVEPMPLPPKWSTVAAAAQMETCHHNRQALTSRHQSFGAFTQSYLTISGRYSDSKTREPCTRARHDTPTPTRRANLRQEQTGLTRRTSAPN